MGIIVAAIGMAILHYYEIMIFATANTIRPPSWLLPVGFLIGLAGILLINQGNKQRQNPS